MADRWEEWTHMRSVKWEKREEWTRLCYMR